MRLKNPAQTVVPTLLSLVALLAVGCSSMTGAPSSAGASMGQAFVIGTDAPAANVVSFTATLESVDAIDSNNNSVPLISGSPTVDFARYNGLQTLLDVDDVPAGTYNSISITLGPSVTVGYLDTTVTPPAVQSTTLSVSTSPINITLPNPVVLTKTSSGGVRLDFDLNKSIQVTNGQISGVNPTFNVGAVYPDDAGAHIDEFVAGVLGVDATNQQFTIQGPHGRQFTVNVNGQTDWDDNSNLGELTTSTIVQISGRLDKSEATINADEVAILSQDKFFASGQITYVTPPTGEASSFDLYVRALEPTNTGLSLGNTATVELNGAEKYYIYWMRNPMTEFLFNSSALVAGQDVAIGGPATGASDPTDVTIKRVVLRQWGFNGTVVPNSVNAAEGTFKMQVTGFAGVLIPTPVTVFIGNATDFRYGFASVSNVAASTRIRVVGLLLKNAANGDVVLLARHIDDRD